MAKENKIITIDTSQWITQVEKAKQLDCRPQYISQLIRLGKLENWHIPELGLNLVRR